MRNHFDLDCIMVTAGCWLLSLRNDQITQIGLFPFLLLPRTNETCTTIWLQSPQLFASYDSGLISNGQFFRKTYFPLSKKEKTNQRPWRCCCLFAETKICRNTLRMPQCFNNEYFDDGEQQNDDFCDIVAATVFHKTLTFRSTGLRLSWQQYKTTTL